MQDDDPLSGESISTQTNSKVNLFRRIKWHFGRAFNWKKSPSISEEVSEFIEEQDPDRKEVSSTERTMVSNILKLNQVSAGYMMIPRSDIVAVSSSIDMNELKKTIIEKEHTRIPVYQDTLDNIIGFVHSKDLLPLMGSKKNFKITEVMRLMLFVPPSMKALDLLVKMRDNRTHMAIVLDEHGGTDGLVTLEDVMEEIVGEIEDEHDDVDIPGVHSIDDHTYHVNARTRIEDLEKELKIELRSDTGDDFDTLGGLVFFMMGRVPKKGEAIEDSNGVRFEVVDADQRRIKMVLINIPEKTNE